MREYSEAYSRIRDKQRRARIRARKRNRLAIKFSFTLSLLLVIGLLFGKINSYAGSRHDKVPTHKCYTSIMINQGDSLDSIAREYLSEDYTALEYSSVSQYINEVKEMNHLRNDTINYGCYIVVPYFTAD